MADGRRGVGDGGLGEPCLLCALGWCLAQSKSRLKMVLGQVLGTGCPVTAALAPFPAGQCTKVLCSPQTPCPPLPSQEHRAP